MPSATRAIEISAPPATLMGVITDFAAYPRFLPEMEEAVVLSHEGPVWTVRFAVRIIRRLEYTLRLVRESDTHLTWTLVGGVFRANDGSWTLTPLAEGAHTRAVYTVDLDLGMFVPGSVMKTLVEINLPATLEAFKVRAESS